jgi:hypothetical protein
MTDTGDDIRRSPTDCARENSHLIESLALFALSLR